MKLNQKSIYALLFAFYVARVGRTNIYTAASELGLSVNFLEQITRKLRVAGLVKSYRGPGGGYSLIGVPTTAQILAAVGTPVEFWNTTGDANSQPEYSILQALTDAMKTATLAALNTPVTSLVTVTPSVTETVMEAYASSPGLEVV